MVQPINNNQLPPHIYLTHKIDLITFFLYIFLIKFATHNRSAIATQVGSQFFLISPASYTRNFSSLKRTGFYTTNTFSSSTGEDIDLLLFPSSNIGKQDAMNYKLTIDSSSMKMSSRTRKQFCEWQPSLDSLVITMLGHE